jgi:hypothetical protein
MDVHAIQQAVADVGNKINAALDTIRTRHEQLDTLDKRMTAVAETSHGPIALNVGGQRFDVSRSTLRRAGGALAGIGDGRIALHSALSSDCDVQVYFIDRAPEPFAHLLQFARASGDGTTLCGAYALSTYQLELLLDEARYWQYVKLESAVCAEQATRRNEPMQGAVPAPASACKTQPRANVEPDSPILGVTPWVREKKQDDNAWATVKVRPVLRRSHTTSTPALSPEPVLRRTHAPQVAPAVVPAVVPAVLSAALSAAPRETEPVAPVLSKQPTAVPRTAPTQPPPAPPPSPEEAPTAMSTAPAQQLTDEWAMSEGSTGADSD